MLLYRVNQSTGGAGLILVDCQPSVPEDVLAANNPATVLAYLKEFISTAMTDFRNGGQFIALLDHEEGGLKIEGMPQVRISANHNKPAPKNGIICSRIEAVQCTIDGAVKLGFMFVVTSLQPSASEIITVIE